MAAAHSGPNCRLEQLRSVNWERRLLQHCKVPSVAVVKCDNSIQWRYSPTGLWPTERPPPVSEASANFWRIEGCHVVSATDPHGR